MLRALAAALLGLALVLAAAGFDSPSLHVPGVLLLVLGGGSAAWVALAHHGSSVRREVGPRTVMEEEPYPLRLEFSSGLLPPPAGELLEPLVAEPVRLGGRAGRRVRVDVRFARRGLRAIEPCMAILHDPLWLAVRERSDRSSAEVIVLPRIEPVVAGGAGATTGGLGETARRLAAGATELELDSLRPYEEGAPASRIHWPTVARTGELLERRLVPDADSRPLVVLDSRRPASEDALDRAVRAAASITVALARAGGCSLLLPGDRRGVEVGPDLHGWPALHIRLALLGPAEEPPAAARLGRAGALFWVMASAAERVPPGLERAAASDRWLVTPGQSEGRGRAAFSVAGCSGYRLGAGRGRAAA